MKNKVILGSSLLLLTLSIPLSVSAYEIENPDRGNYYNTNHQLFMEYFPAEKYQFSENTQMVKDILKYDTGNGYLGYPVDIRLNIIADGESKEIRVYDANGGYSIDEFLNSNRYKNLNDSQKQAFDKYLKDYQDFLANGGSGGFGLGGSDFSSGGSSGLGDNILPDNNGVNVGDLFNNNVVPRI